MNENASSNFNSQFFKSTFGRSFFVTWAAFLFLEVGYRWCMIRFSVITLFPHFVEAYTSDSILGRAQEKGIIEVRTYNPREFTKAKWHRVDRRPYGGGPGMVLEAEPFIKAAMKAKGRKTKRVKIVFFATDGKQFTNRLARRWVRMYDHVILLCGRYEGIDSRVQKILRAEKISIGPYVLTGGEVPAMVLIDVLSRQVPGVLGKFSSLEEMRVASPEVYTRPEVLKWKGKIYRVPRVLLSGHHGKMEAWKKKKARHL